MTGLSPARLKLVLAVFFVALAVPGVVLVITAYQRLEWGAFHQYRVLAEELSERIDARFTRLLDAEEALPYTAYGFLVVAGDQSANFVQRSPLSKFPVAASIPGLIGYFQVDADGTLSTPLLPGIDHDVRAYGVSASEHQARLALERNIHAILSENQLVAARGARAKGDAAGAIAITASVGGKAFEAEEVSISGSLSDLQSQVSQKKERFAKPSDDRATPQALAAPYAAPAPAQAAFDELKTVPVRERVAKQAAGARLGRVDELKLDAPFQDQLESRQKRSADSDAAKLTEYRNARKEQSIVPALPSVAAKDVSAPIRAFESEIDPFELSLLNSGHLVLYRKVWRDGQRTIQGALINRQVFVADLIESAFRATALADMSNLAAAWQGEVVTAYGSSAGRRYLESATELAGALLYRTRLAAPADDLELVYTVARLPPGPGAQVIIWMSIVLVIVLCGGTVLMYRLGARQLALARQQQDFVSAVSHELKTPLTSIRMYAEMLREGWAREDKKRGYYDYIHTESERLSRLIANVLQLARFNRGEIDFSLTRVSAGELIDEIRSKVSSQVEHAGFELRIACDHAAVPVLIDVDRDAVSQILINLVDNALKFSSAASIKAVEIGCRLGPGHRVVFSVRDFGPGIARDQMRKIFGLFYRAENELTRETIGTGIGLALVHQLATAMGVRVDVVNAEPGARFTLAFVRTSPTSTGAT